MNGLIKIVLVLFLFGRLYGAQVKWEFHFESNEFKLSVNEQKRLEKLKNVMAKLNVDSIWIVGFADKDGGDKSNLILSKYRANEIVMNLNLSDSIYVKKYWYGENFEGYINDTALKFKNRKVEVVIWHSGKKYPPVYFNGMLLKKGDAINLPAIRFVPGKSIMLPGGEKKLEEIVEVLKKNPTVKFLIEGHVCCHHEVELSENRARTIYCYLIEKGINKNRLKYFGYGLSKPAYSANDARNRRVVLKVLDV